MARRNYDLPSLKMIGTFEAAARVGSFKDAAEELGVTPGAVSHQIRGLEAALDMALFIRQSRAVSLTPTGRALFEVVNKSLVEIDQTVRQLRVDWIDYGGFVPVVDPEIGAVLARQRRYSYQPRGARSPLPPPTKSGLNHRIRRYSAARTRRDFVPRSPVTAVQSRF